MCEPIMNVFTNSQVAELVDAKIMGGQRAIGEEPRKLRIQVQILS